MRHLRANIVELALAQKGKPYANQGWGPQAFDCIGLCGFCWRRAGVIDYELAQEPDLELRNYSSAPQPIVMRKALSRYLTWVDKREAQLGDALWFRSPKAQHLGILTHLRSGLFYVIHADIRQMKVRLQQVRNDNFVICAWRPPELVDG